MSFNHRTNDSNILSEIKARSDAFLILVVELSASLLVTRGFANKIWKTDLELWEDCQTTCDGKCGVHRCNGGEARALNELNAHFRLISVAIVGVF